MEIDLKQLLTQWVDVKAQERETAAWRRDIEDQLIQRLRLNDMDKNVTKEVEGFKVVASCRIDKKVDVQSVQEIAAEHGLQHELDNLFRWKAELNQRAWSKSDPEIIEKLQPAITIKNGRPSFKIEEL